MLEHFDGDGKQTSEWLKEGDEGEVVVAVTGNHQVASHRSEGEGVERRRAEDGMGENKVK
ncbi:hypothetical protein C1H46_003023 [Malus baccata]|uniref:Uncharacterized protein n=1 Tax=Malus baccata TaxID=106549 RepID=A0A540NJT2_MALBA|nr:hypothetical protein C1H46_003023 [Malus baccata]